MEIRLTARKALAIGAAVWVGLLAVAMNRWPQNPDRVIAQMAGRVRVDPRIERTDPNVRRALLCVSLAVYFESRAEPDRGQVAVAHVVKTRTEERHENACRTVFAPWQFSWSHYQLQSLLPGDAAAWARSQEVALRVFLGGEANPAPGANHFFAHRSVRPAWRNRGVSRVVIGNHTFLRIGRRL